METKRVTISCPICKKEVEVELPVLLVKEAPDGILKIHIPQERCCPLHSFMVFIDKNFKVRGYQHADLEFNLKARAGARAIPPGLDEDDVLSFDVNELISTVGTDIAAMMLRTILINKPILFMNTFDLNNRAEKAIKLFQDMESDDLVITAEIIDQKRLGDKGIEKSNPFVYAILYRAILRSPLPEKARIALETALLGETSEIPDRQGQVAFLRRELVKISRVVNEFAIKLKDVPQIYEEDIPDFLQRNWNYKLSGKRVDGFREILAARHGGKLAGKIKSKSVEYLL
ncbi:MAG: hypothetical protein JW839_22650 [Candidatus Lokiarchaeota archaeon]|nr:hypothetical protein [Candidatus Lokiarchaeota archaeon]